MKSVHILLVEDNEGDIFLTKEALNDVKINVELSVLKDGKAAIDFMGKQGIYKNSAQPDILLLDLNLPKKNGFEVLNYVKQNNATKHIPVIILSTSVSDKDIAKSYGHYANCYISKPVDATQFIDIIDTIENFWTSIVRLPVNKTNHQ